MLFFYFFDIRGRSFNFWIKNVPVLNKIFCHEKMPDDAYNLQLWKENTLTFPKLQRYYLWVPQNWCYRRNQDEISNRKCPRFWMRKEWAYTFCRFPKVSAALWRICRHIIGRLIIRDYIYQVSARCLASKLVRNLQLHVFSHFLQRRNQTATNYLSSIDMWKTPWGLILNNVCHVSVDIMELIWQKVWRCNDWIFCFFS